jgi:hypothetical protein
VQFDWSTAEVKPPSEGEPFMLEVALKGSHDKAFQEAWKRETRELAQALGDDRRSIEEWGTSRSAREDTLHISVSPIDPNDAGEERRILEDLLGRANRAAAPRRAKYSQEDRKRREDQAARAKQAESLTEQFRS